MSEASHAQGVADGSAAVLLDSVSCVFGGAGRHARPYTAVKDISFSVADGEFVSIVGPTGCGKSTVLNMIAGLLKPASGSVMIFGQALRALNERAGYLFQSEALMPWRTALQNVTAGLEIRGEPREQCREKGERWLQRVGLAGRSGSYLHQLSGGMRRRVALAQLLILEPKILLMDEPFGALDIQTRQLMENELLGLWSSERSSVVFITHDLEEAISLSDRVLVLSSGPGSTLIGEFSIDLPRPRDVVEVRLTPDFLRLHGAIWATLRDEVMKGYLRNERQ